MPPEVIAQLQLVTTGLPHGILARASPTEDPTLAKLRNMQDKGARRTPSRNGNYSIGQGLRRSTGDSDRKDSHLHTRGESMAGIFGEYSSNGATIDLYPLERETSSVSRSGWRGVLDRTRNALASRFHSTENKSRTREPAHHSITPYVFSNVIPMEDRTQNRADSVYFMDDAGVIRKSSYPQSPARHRTPLSETSPIPPVPPLPTVPATTHLAHARSLSPSGVSGMALSVESHSRSELLHSTSNPNPFSDSVYTSITTSSNSRPPAYNYQPASTDLPRAVNDPFYAYYRQANAFFDPGETGARANRDRGRVRLSKPLPPTPATGRTSLQMDPPPFARSPALLD